MRSGFILLLSVLALASCERGRSSFSGDVSFSDGGVAVGGVFDEDGDGGIETDGSSCADPQAPDVTVSVWPGQDPVAAETVIGDFECVIDVRNEFPAQVELVLTCADAAGPLADSVEIALQASGIEVPPSLGAGIPVRARVNTWRDAEYFDQYPWRRSDHFALYRDDVLVLAGGSGTGLPVDANGDDDLEFFAPVLPIMRWVNCGGLAIDCHHTIRRAWEIEVGEEFVTSPAFAVVQVGGYDIHLGELVTDENADCGEPRYGRMGFAIAQTP